MGDINKAGIITGLVVGVGALILAVIVIFVVVSTIDEANLLRETASTTTTTDLGAILNSSATHTLTDWTARGHSWAITLIVNGSTGDIITTGNYTFDSTDGTIVNSTAWVWDNVNITYTYIGPTNYEDATDAMTGNFTEGVDNVSTKIPTILLIGAVVLLFGVIVLLVRQSQAMGIGPTAGSQGSL